MFPSVAIVATIDYIISIAESGSGSGSTDFFKDTALEFCW